MQFTCTDITVVVVEKQTHYHLGKPNVTEIEEIIDLDEIISEPSFEIEIADSKVAEARTLTHLRTQIQTILNREILSLIKGRKVTIKPLATEFETDPPLTKNNFTAWQANIADGRDPLGGSGMDTPE